MYSGQFIDGVIKFVLNLVIYENDQYFSMRYLPLIAGI